MFAIPKTPEHPADVAARERLRAIVCGPLQAALSDWGQVLCRLGRDPGDGTDEYYDEVACLIIELEERLDCGRKDRQSSLKSAAEGGIVPLFDANGNPVMRHGEQMYTTPEHAKRIEAAVGALAQWLDHAPDQAAVKCLLRGDHPELQPDEVDYALREAAKIRRGGQP